MNFDIIDVQFFDVVEYLYPGWNIMSCEVTLSDGETILGTIQGDGISSYSIDSFEPDDEDPI